MKDIEHLSEDYVKGFSDGYNAARNELTKSISSIVSNFMDTHPIQDRSLICKRCHRILKTPEAQALGYGPICYEKMKSEQRVTPLFSSRDGK